ncbi:NinG protein [Vibrio phage 1.182.O._10N.286.46.E1]|nr:NinG protein [Vibrio phage 1.182.O._10N.286.46.E1]
MKTSPADSAFSKCIRAANDYTCKRCGKQYDQSSTGLHCSHNFSRRHRTIRWCKDNAIPLCYSCHQWYGGEPLDSGRWLEDFIGLGTVELLREKMNSKIKVTKLEEKEIAKHYREQLKLIQERRESGEVGYIDFISYQ